VRWKRVGIIALGSVAACGLSATGELSVDGGSADAGLRGPTFDGNGMTTPDSGSPMKDATAHEDAKKDTGTKGKDSASDTSPHADGTAPNEASAGHDGASTDAAEESGSSKDSGKDAEDAHGAVDAAPDAKSLDAGKDAGPPDAAKDTGSGVDAVAPPTSCGFPSYSYSCGSKTCGCNQLCDDGSACGACSPHFGSCALDLHSCDTDFSSATSCGGCGNVCCLGFGTCSLSGGTYSCDPC